MPFEIMDQRGLSASSNFFEDVRFCSERNGLWKPKDMHDLSGTGRMGALSGGMSSRAIFDTSSPVEQTDLQSEQMNPPRDLTSKQFLGGKEGFRNAFKPSNHSLHQHLRPWSNVITPPASSSVGLGGTKIVTDAGSHESSLFSSSLSEIFTSKMRLSANDALSHHPAHTIVSNNREESCGYHRENVADHIENLLPDEDNFFSGVIDDLGYNADGNTGIDLDDFDLFSSGGGLELEVDNVLMSEKRRIDFGGQNYLGGMSGKSQLLEHPSRTLLVRNIDSNVEDSEVTVLFEQFGDIRTVFTACKHRGFVMVLYYDLRASQNAMRALQNKPLRHRKLDIYYSKPKDKGPEKDLNHGILAVSDLDPSVSIDELQHIFGFYGEIKYIYEIPEKHQVKFIEFYDVRASDSALKALSDSKIAGRQIKLEPCGPEDATSLMQYSQRGKDGHNIGNNFPYMNQAATYGANAPVCLDTGHQGLCSSMGQVTSSYAGSSLPNGNRKTTLANTLPTPVGRSSAEKLVGFVDGVKTTSVPRFHAHSSPEYHDTVSNGVFCNSPSKTMDFAGNMGSRFAEGFGSPGNGNYTPQGLHCMWNKSNLHQQHPNLMMWQNSPPFVNGACAPHLSQMSGYPRVPPHILRASHIDHHVGSSPVVNGSPRDRRLNHLGDSPKGSSFHLDSLGNTGFPGTWQLNLANMPPQNMFSHVGGNHMDMTANAGQSSSRQIWHVFPGRNPVMSKHDAASECSRNMYHRRGDLNISNFDKKQFELNIERIVRGEDSRTTLMIKNIPNKYTSKMLLAAIDEQCRGTYDFIYLPIDFKNKCNVGYAFINMIDPSQILPFYQAFNGKKWEKFNSEKVASLAFARIQGKAALIAHFQNSSLMNEDKRCRPILFHTEGPNAGDPEPFPMGRNIRSGPGKYRSSANEEYRSQGNPSTSTGGENSSSAMNSSMASD